MENELDYKKRIIKLVEGIENLNILIKIYTFINVWIK